MSEPAVLALHEALRSGFATLSSSRGLWSSELAECAPLLQSVGNLAEQMAALAAVDLSSTPLRDFPQLEERLRFKLELAVDATLREIHDRMCKLRSLRDAISHQTRTVLRLYEQSGNRLHLQAVTERSGATPSVADMLEWLQDADRHHRQQFLRMRFLLETLGPGDPALLESAPARWKSLESPDAEQQITDNLCRVHFFLEFQ